MAGETGLNIVKDGLIAYYDATNTKSYISGSLIWNDLSRNNINGTLTNGPTYNSSNGGNIVLDGVDDYINGGSTLNSLSSNILSAFIWFKCTRTSSEPLLFRTNDYTTGWNLNVSNGILRSTLRPSVGNNNNNYAGAITTNTWYYAGFTCDGTTIKQYLNGVEVSQTPVATTLNLNDSNTLRIGGNAIYGTFSLQGSVSNVQIYSKSLTAAEVKQNYNTMKSRFNI
jgi:hypothetical protein